LDSGNFFDSGSKHQGPDTLFGSSSFFGASSKLYTGGTIGSYEDSNDSFLKDENFKDRGTESPNKVQKKAEKIMVCYYTSIDSRGPQLTLESLFRCLTSLCESPPTTWSLLAKSKGERVTIGITLTSTFPHPKILVIGLPPTGLGNGTGSKIVTGFTFPKTKYGSGHYTLSEFQEK